MLGLGKGELGTELSFLPKNRSGSGEVDSAGTFHVYLFALPFFLNTVSFEIVQHICWWPLGVPGGAGGLEPEPGPSLWRTDPRH